VAYCAHCRLGTIDDQGLCRLCGAPERPPSRLRRLLDASGGLLGALLSPGLGALIVLVGMLLVAAVVATGRLGPARALGPGGLLRPPGAPVSSSGDPLAVVVQLLLPALVQALLFGLLLAGLFFLLRRRRPGGAPADRDLRS
jgi:hypothetical protein